MEKVNMTAGIDVQNDGYTIIKNGIFEKVTDIKEKIIPDKITVTKQAIIGEPIERPLPKQYKKNPGAINKDRRNIAEATKLLGLKTRKAFKKFAKKLRVNPNILAG